MSLTKQLSDFLGWESNLQSSDHGSDTLTIQPSKLPSQIRLCDDFMNATTTYDIDEVEAVYEEDHAYDYDISQNDTAAAANYDYGNVTNFDSDNTTASSNSTFNLFEVQNCTEQCSDPYVVDDYSYDYD